MKKYALMGLSLSAALMTSVQVAHAGDDTPLFQAQSGTTLRFLIDVPFLADSDSADFQEGSYIGPSNDQFATWTGLSSVTSAIGSIRLRSFSKNDDRKIPAGAILTLNGRVARTIPELLVLVINGSTLIPAQDNDLLKMNFTAMELNSQSVPELGCFLPAGGAYCTIGDVKKAFAGQIEVIEP